MKTIRQRAERLIRKFRVHSCPVPFVIWFRERTGSTHLCSILNSHPQVVCRQEDFHEVVIDEHVDVPNQVVPIKIGSNISCFRRISHFDSQYIDDPTSKQIVTQLYDIFACPTYASGFKLKYPTQDRLYPEVMEELSTLGAKLRVISLSRHNVLKQAISSQNMRRIRAATKGACFNLTHEVANDIKEKVKSSRIKIDVEEVVMYARQLQRERSGFEERLKQFQANCENPILSINYEELLNDESATVARVLDYLGVDSRVRYFSRIQKATTDKLSEAIDNYEELVAAVKDTELEALLT